MNNYTKVPVTSPIQKLETQDLPPSYAYVEVSDTDSFQDSLEDKSLKQSVSSLDIIQKAWLAREEKINNTSEIRCNMINAEFDRRVASINTARNKKLWLEENRRRITMQKFQQDKLKAATMISGGHWLWLASTTSCSIS